MSIESRNGLFWPALDRVGYEAALSEVKDVHKAIAYIPNETRHRRVAIQAGGNCGVWAREIAPLFETVYTFEPDVLNFTCLVHNVPRANVIKMQACLGDKPGLVSLDVDPRNIGAHIVGGEGRIPTLRIDDLGLQACDFIQLDVEGYEGFALMGAEETLKKFGPVLMLELKGVGDRFNFPDADVLEYLSQFGYKIVERCNKNRDTILKRG